MIEREDIREPTTLLRIFSKEQKYGDKYVAVMTLKWVSKDTVEALGFHGNMEPFLFKELTQWFKDNGVKHVKATRHGKEHNFSF